MTVASPAQQILQTRDVGRLIAAGRKRARLSQTDFAAQLGVSRKTVSDLERGVAAHVSLNTALQALTLAGLVLEARPRRPPTITEVMARRAADRERADQLTGEATARARRRG
ncbi:MAG TPA: helix-turn-helix domain-containing protein [Steroidobacter sp.]